MEDHLLKDLPAYLADSIHAVYEVDDELLQASVLRNIQLAGFRERYVMKKARFEFNFFITHTSRRKFVLVFNEKKAEERLLMKAAIRFDFKPVPGREVASVSRLLSGKNAPDLYFWNMPSPEFLERIKQYGNLRDASTFFACNEEIRNWVRQNEAGENNFPVSLDSVTFNNSQNEILRMIGMLLRCFRILHSTKIREQRNRLADASSILHTGRLDFDIRNFQAEVFLRLTENGSLALKEKQESFELKIAFKVHTDNQQIITNMSFAPPDFLIQGALFDAFFTCLLEEHMADDEVAFEDEDLDEASKAALMAEELQEIGLTPLAKISRKLDDYPAEKIRKIFEQSRAGSGSIYRIKKRKRFDVNLLILSGEIEGEEIKLVLSGKFKIQFEFENVPRVQLKNKRSLQVLYGPGRNDVDRKAVRYFSRIFSYLGDWVKLVQK